MKKFITGVLFIFAIFMTFCISQATTIIAPHWKDGNITVYIPKDARAEQMKRAFMKWQNASFGKLNFTFQEKGPANIDVVFTEAVDGADGPIGSYNVTIQNGLIKKAEIKMATKSKNISKYSNSYIYTTMLHEVGHALGLSDTNRKGSSIMFMPVTEQQDLLKIDMMKLYNLNNWSWMDHRIQQQ